MAEHRWTDLEPEPGIVAALDHAGPRPEGGEQKEKRRWSEKFADGCAVAIADQFRAAPFLKRKNVQPISLAAGTEPLTPLGAGASKRIDVTVTDPVLGLEIGASLKGLNFVDEGSGNYDKNLTGRMYELADEVRLVHEHLPHAFMVAVFFLPLASCTDKTELANSSFANAITKLRSRTGRLDAALAAHSPKCDAAYVGLYQATEAGGYKRGVVRFMNVMTAPPRRGRPRVASTLDLRQMIEQVVDAASHEGSIEWSPAEPDQDDS